MKIRFFASLALLISIGLLSLFSIKTVFADSISTETVANSSFSKIKAGNWHTCGLTLDNKVKCWGHNALGELGNGTAIQSSVPVNTIGITESVTDIALGYAHTCALTISGGVKCWGLNDGGLLGDGTENNSSIPVDVVGLSTGVTAISAGAYHTCALTTDTTIKCWGHNWRGQLGNIAVATTLVPVNVMNFDTVVNGIVKLATSYSSTCALHNSSNVSCWGDIKNGSPVPSFVNDLPAGVTDITAGGFHFCALFGAGNTMCWGENLYGQLGDGTNDERAKPVDVTGLGSTVSQIIAGGDHTCALLTNKSMKCWGANNRGQLGNGTTTENYTPINVVGLATDIATIGAGTEHTCVLLSDGTPKCWGNNEYGQLGDGVTIFRAVPMDVPLAGVTEVAGGGNHTCAIANEAVMCWGENRWGALGDGTNHQSSIPVKVDGITNTVKSIAAGWEHTCALTINGSVKCWGSIQNTNIPTDVIGLTDNVTEIVSGGYHSCALSQTGGMKCWGLNRDGELGDGSNVTYRSIPVDVVGLTSGVTGITAGFGHTCALTLNGGVKCWGDNRSGQLGNNSNTSTNVPVDVSGLTLGVIAISAGTFHSCALTADHAVKCWGSGSWGQVNSPVEVTVAGSNFRQIESGGSHLCVTTLNSAVKCLGGNHLGMLGDGSVTERSTFVDVVGMTQNVQMAIAGAFHSCAILSSGRLKCWGSDGRGQLGIGTTVQRTTLTDVTDAITPTVSLNYPDGKPGSFLTVTGENFPPTSTMTVTINQTIITTTLTTNELGSFVFFLNTEGIEPGSYEVTVSVNPSASTSFVLKEEAPLRVLEGGGIILDVPEGIAESIRVVYLPLTMR